MANGDEKICNAVREALNQNGVLEGEHEIQYATKFSVKSGANKAGVIVYNSGKIHVEGADSELKKWVTELKTSIESGAAAPGILFPPKSKNFPKHFRNGRQIATASCCGSFKNRCAVTKPVARLVLLSCLVQQARKLSCCLLMLTGIESRTKKTERHSSRGSITR
jgi:hypothetical protein